jgi:hypothetical protein
MRLIIAGKMYAEDDPDLPSGSLGADPALFAPFGVGEVDTEQLGALLRGDRASDADGTPQVGTRPWLFEESRHVAILEILNLDPRPLIGGFRHLDLTTLPRAVHVRPE